MTTSLWLTGLTSRRRHVASAALACALLFSTTAAAQTDAIAPVAGTLRAALDRQLPAGAFDTRDSNLPTVIEQQERHQPLATRIEPALTQPPRQMSTPPVARQRSVRAKQVAGAVIGAIGGFMIGGRLGGWLEGDSATATTPASRAFSLVHRSAPASAPSWAPRRLELRRGVSSCDGPDKSGPPTARLAACS